MDFDSGKVDEVVLAMLHLTSLDDHDITRLEEPRLGRPRPACMRED
jgi:hypothetical protein